MKLEVAIEAEPRGRLGKGASRHLRREGRIPITLYGGENEAVSLSVNRPEFEKVFRGEAGANAIFQLQWEGQSSPVILKDWQVDPVKGTLVHADLIRISMKKVTRVRVPIELEGEPFGVKTQGGLIDFSMHHIEVECLPGDIPDRIRIDVTSLKVGEHVSVKDLDLGEKVRILEDADRVIAGVLAPRLEVTPTAVVAEEGEAAPSATPEGAEE